MLRAMYLERFEADMHIDFPKEHICFSIKQA
jgi:hypothetical protein